MSETTLKNVRNRLARAGLVLACVAGATLARASTDEERRILHLADGTCVRALARDVEGGIEAKIGGRWRPIPAGEVVRARPEREVLAERRSRLDAVPPNHVSRRVAVCGWMIEEGLDAEAADELDRILRVVPDERSVLQLLAARPPRIVLGVEPGADGSMRAALLREGARTCTVGGSHVRRELVVQALREEALRAADEHGGTATAESRLARGAMPAETDATRAAQSDPPAPAGGTTTRAAATPSTVAPASTDDVPAVEGPLAALHSVLVEELDSSVNARRAFACVALRRLFAAQTIGPLAVHAILDPAMDVRNEATLGLREARDVRACGAVVQALCNPSGVVRTHAVEALGRMGYPEAVEPLVNLMLAASAAQSGSGGGPVRAHVFFGLQTAYVQDFNVEIAQAASIADPIINVLQHGVVFDVGVGGMSSVTVTTEIWSAARSLGQLTGARIGVDPPAWERWWKANRHKYVPGAEREPDTRDG